jgi:hypothetical protein
VRGSHLWRSIPHATSEQAAKRRSGFVVCSRFTFIWRVYHERSGPSQEASGSGTELGGKRCTSRHTQCTVDREKETHRFCFQVHKRMLEVDYPAQLNIASVKHNGIASEAGHTWSGGGLHLANRRKSRRDRDYHGLPVGCESLERRREKTDRIGEHRW